MDHSGARSCRPVVPKPPVPVVSPPVPVVPPVPSVLLEPPQLGVKTAKASIAQPPTANKTFWDVIKRFMRIPPGMMVNWGDMCGARGGVIKKRSEVHRIVSR